MADSEKIENSIADLRREHGCYPWSNIQKREYDPLIEAMGCAGTSPKDKVNRLITLINIFFEHEPETAGLLLVSLNLHGDAYADLGSSQRRCLRYKGTGAEHLTDKELRADKALWSVAENIRYEEGKAISRFAHWLAEAAESGEIAIIFGNASGKDEQPPPPTPDAEKCEERTRQICASLDEDRIDSLMQTLGVHINGSKIDKVNIICQIVMGDNNTISSNSDLSDTNTDIATDIRVNSLSQTQVNQEVNIYEVEYTDEDFANMSDEELWAILDGNE